MSRVSPGITQIEVRPTNNIYTVLLAVAVLIEIIGLLVLLMQASALFGKGLFSS